MKSIMSRNEQKKENVANSQEKKWIRETNQQMIKMLELARRILK